MSNELVGMTLIVKRPPIFGGRFTIVQFDQLLITHYSFRIRTLSTYEDFSRATHY